MPDSEFALIQDYFTGGGEGPAVRLGIGDDAVAPLMAGFTNSSFAPAPIEAGECATAGLAALLAAKKDPALWQELGFGSQSVVLLIGTEGATDPFLYQQLIAAGRQI